MPDSIGPPKSWTIGEVAAWHAAMRHAALACEEAGETAAAARLREIRARGPDAAAADEARIAKARKAREAAP